MTEAALAARSVGAADEQGAMRLRKYNRARTGRFLLMHVLHNGERPPVC